MPSCGFLLCRIPAKKQPNAMRVFLGKKYGKRKGRA
jgi:hypothetical protein